MPAARPCSRSSSESVAVSRYSVSRSSLVSATASSELRRGGRRPGPTSFGGRVVFGALSPHVGVAGDEVDDAGEALDGADRHLHGDAVAAELGLDLAQSFVEVGVFTVHAVDDDGAGDAALCGHLPGMLGADLHARGGADHDYGGVGGRETAVGLADEVGVTGGVDEVELVVFPLRGEEGGVDADLALDLVGVEVGGRGAVFDASEAVNGAADE